jgi:hypothetical protein
VHPAICANLVLYLCNAGGIYEYRLYLALGIQRYRTSNIQPPHFLGSSISTTSPHLSNIQVDWNIHLGKSLEEISQYDSSSSLLHRAGRLPSRYVPPRPFNPPFSHSLTTPFSNGHDIRIHLPPHMDNLECLNLRRWPLHQDDRAASFLYLYLNSLYGTKMRALPQPRCLRAWHRSILL